MRLYPPSLKKHHRSNYEYLEGKRENYQVCSVQYCVLQLCTLHSAMHTHMNRPSSCLLVRFSFSVIILRVTFYLCQI